MYLEYSVYNIDFHLVECYTKIKSITQCGVKMKAMRLAIKHQLCFKAGLLCFLRTFLSKIT